MFQSPRNTLVVLSSLVITHLALSACGGTPLRNPAAPSSSTTNVTASISPVPLTLRATGDGVSYALSAEASFRDVGGESARVASIDIELLDTAGQSELRHVTFDLALEPGTTVTRPISETLRLGNGHQPARIRLRATIVGGDGISHVLPDIDTPVIVVGSPATSPPAPDATFVGAGDIANCDVPGSQATARLLDLIPGDVFTLGDNVYPNGTTDSFTRCYEPTWGRHRNRTHPNPGNHDWDVAAGAPYFGYYGSTAGPSGLGYYSFDLGAWHILSLNSNISAGPGSAQYEWARRDLSATSRLCSLAYWHHPLFSSGPNGNNAQMREMWRLLDQSGVELVLVGHDHLYERFAPQDADGNATPTGMREFVVGTGGTQLYSARSIQPNSEVRGTDTWGVLKLSLRGDRYDWEYVPVEGQSFRDAGSAGCTP